jgi:4-hydroxybenzoate polyprenyltransferase
MIRKYLELVKFSHTLFAMPFALMAMLVAAGGMPSARVLVWILFAMVFARTMAMTFNRLMDRDIDSQNPRTASRPTVTGEVSTASAWVLWTFCSAGLFLSAWMLNPVCLALAPVVWMVLNGYSFGKRFTHWTHLWLGFALGLAPLGAWVAVTGRIEWQPVPLGLAVLVWVAGFDIIYSLQDEEVDHLLGLHSLVVRFGPAGALILSRVFHLAALLLLLSFGLLMGLGRFYYYGVAIVAVALAVEQSMVSDEDRSRINAAFFTANGFVSLVLLAATSLDVFLR